MDGRLSFLVLLHSLYLLHVVLTCCFIWLVIKWVISFTFYDFNYLTVQVALKMIFSIIPLHQQGRLRYFFIFCKVKSVKNSDFQASRTDEIKPTVFRLHLLCYCQMEQHLFFSYTFCVDEKNYYHCMWSVWIYSRLFNRWYSFFRCALALFVFLRNRRCYTVVIIFGAGWTSSRGIIDKSFFISWLIKIFSCI